MNSVLLNGLDELNISYDEKQLEQTDAFYEMLIEKNKVMNLTRITDREDFYIKHVLDSLLIAKLYGDDIKGMKILDVGTGAGFPGIPLKIFYPDTEITLLDSLNKRLLFLDEVIENLGLSNISTIHGRAEELGHNKEYRESFDLVVSRAVADMSVLSELCIPFVKVGGSFVAYKSSDSDEEIARATRAIKILSGSEANIHDIPLSDTDIIRKLVETRKYSSTPKSYPRKPGTPTKKPL